MENKPKGIFMLAKDWEDLHPRIRSTMDKVDDMHALIPEIHQKTNSLENLSSLPVIAGQLKTLIESLVAPATGRDQMPTKTASLIFKILGIVIFALTGIIIFLLTGAHYNFLPALQGLR